MTADLVKRKYEILADKPFCRRHEGAYHVTSSSDRISFHRGLQSPEAKESLMSTVALAM